MPTKITVHLTILAAFCTCSVANAQLLGSANDFAVLAGSTVTNTGLTVLNGDLGIWPGTGITGFGPGVDNGTIHFGDTVAKKAEADLVSAYNLLAGETVTQDLTGQDLGGLTLTPGVYKFSSTAALTGSLTLNAEGDPNARFDFLVGTSFATSAGSSVNVINGGNGRSVYWQVGSSAVLGTGTAFSGNLLAGSSITMGSGATILSGSALAINGAVTLDSNLINAVPEPSAAWGLGVGLAIFSLGCLKKAG